MGSREDSEDGLHRGFGFWILLWPVELGCSTFLKRGVSGQYINITTVPEPVGGWQKFSRETRQREREQNSIVSVGKEIAWSGW